MNHPIFAGRIISEPEFKTIGSDKPLALASFAMTVQVPRPKKQNEQYAPSFKLNVTIKGMRAESFYNHFKKGDVVAVDGYLEVREFTRKDGTKGQSVEIPDGNWNFLPKPSSVEAASNDLPF